MAHYLVTGGAGFIGSHLSDRLLAEGHTVTILDNLSTGRLENLSPQARFIAGDVADSLTVRRAARSCDGIFHLAAVASVQKSHHAWLNTHRSNLFGSIAILEAARDLRPDAPLPVVYASSAAVYGAAENVPLSECDVDKPLSAYGVDKLTVEAHARIGGAIHGVPTCGLRFFNVYGPRQDPHSPYSGVISIFIESIRRERPLVLFGDGGQTRDFIFVADVVECLARAMTGVSVGAPVFNVCTGRETAIRDLAAMLVRLSGRNADIRNAAPRSGDIVRSCGNPAEALAALAFSAQIPLARGLAATLEDAVMRADLALAV